MPEVLAMHTVPYFQTAAFTDKPFKGNPAGVCVLPDWPSDATLKAVTAELRMPVTAFIVGDHGHLKLRWFTAVAEEEMCGHGTLAAAWVVFNHLAPGTDRVTFHTRAGELVVAYQNYRFVLDLPARPPHPIASKPEIAAAIGIEPEEYLLAAYNIAVLKRGEDVANLNPALDLVAKLDRPGLIVTAPGDGFDCDIVTRYFAPAKGISEDAVTGSAHAQIVPYWSKRLGKSSLQARQLSTRGGGMLCENTGSHIRITTSVCGIVLGELLIADAICS